MGKNINVCVRLTLWLAITKQIIWQILTMKTNFMLSV